MIEKITCPILAGSYSQRSQVFVHFEEENPDAVMCRKYDKNTKTCNIIKEAEEKDTSCVYSHWGSF